MQGTPSIISIVEKEILGDSNESHLMKQSILFPNINYSMTNRWNEEYHQCHISTHPMDGMENETVQSGNPLD